jgi:hypothetical protein
VVGRVLACAWDGRDGTTLLTESEAGGLLSAVHDGVVSVE